MSDKFVSASSQYLSTASLPISGFPFSILCRARIISLGSGSKAYLFGLSNSAANNEYVEGGVGRVGSTLSLNLVLKTSNYDNGPTNIGAFAIGQWVSLLFSPASFPLMFASIAAGGVITMFDPGGGGYTFPTGTNILTFGGAIINSAYVSTTGGVYLITDMAIAQTAVTPQQFLNYANGYAAANLGLGGNLMANYPGGQLTDATGNGFNLTNNNGATLNYFDNPLPSSCGGPSPIESFGVAPTSISRFFNRRRGAGAGSILQQANAALQ